MAGYSGTPLPKKLGIKEGHRLALLSAPRALPAGLDELPKGVTVTRRASGGTFDVIVLFTDKQNDLEQRFAETAKRLEPNGGLWVAWPKKSSGVATDLTEDRVRDIALAAGLVDNKVCAIDEVWSGLRCVYRLADRPRSESRSRAKSTKVRTRAAK
ncbi:MAG TPA: DUF3052 family protein [Polyangiaceae bacterium]|jgi:hypothetical protein|nr:DUF3052 family protein [Polyangiaceae bacterium]